MFEEDGTKAIIDMTSIADTMNTTMVMATKVVTTIIAKAVNTTDSNSDRAGASRGQGPQRTTRANT